MEVTLFDNILIQAILIIFPILAWIVYQVYMKNIDREKTNMMYDVVLISMAYFLMKLTKGDNRYILYFTLMIPPVLAYVKKRKHTFLLLSMANVLYFYRVFQENLYFLLLEFGLCYFLYKVYEKRKQPFQNYYFITLVKLIFAYGYLLNQMVIDWENGIRNFGILTTVYLLVVFIILLLKKSEDMVLYANAVSMLEKEKKMQQELFKITHEIKNPIAVCKGYLDMFDINNQEHAKKYIPILKEEIEKVLTLLQDFLSIRKIKIEKEHIDIYYLLENAVDSIGPLLHEKNIHFTCQIPDEELYVEADYNRLNQVIINIFKNSVEAMSTTKKKELKLSAITKKGNIYIEIEDSGIGMSKEEIKHLEEPFFTTKRTGNGIGVYLSKEIMKRHGGSLVFTSKQKEGTIATMVLPIKC